MVGVVVNCLHYLSMRSTKFSVCSFVTNLHMSLELIKGKNSAVMSPSNPNDAPKINALTASETVSNIAFYVCS